MTADMTEEHKAPVAGYTPGRGRNWIASTGPHGYGAHDGVTVTDNRGLVVAVAIGDVPELDALATARLISAAPDLLAALVWVRRCYRPDDDSDMVKTMDAAILAATGEQS